jgi:hypothetical protein
MDRIDQFFLTLITGIFNINYVRCNELWNA